MPRWLAWTLGALFVLALGLHAHQPLLGLGASDAGFCESDLRALLGVSDCLEHGRVRTEISPYFAAIDAGLRPLAALSLTISSALWTDGGALGGARALPLRLENLILMALASAGAAVFLRRVTSPWLGDEHARAAGWVLFVFCLLHPLAFSSIVSLAARGDLIVLALGSWAGADFLRGRHTREAKRPIRAGAVVLLASFASGLAWILPVLLAAAEFLAGRRFRTWWARLRTGLVTLLAFGACAAAEPLLRSLLGAAREAGGAGGSSVEALALAVEKFGVLALPVNAASLSFAAYLLAAALLAIALEPAFSAARSAPRLWSLILAVGSAAVLAASFAGSGVRVSAGDFTHAEVLLPGLFATCAGLALASTALSGLRRLLLPAILATGWAALANVHANSWAESVQVFALARADVSLALAATPRPAALCLLDVPERVEGFAPLERGRSQSFLSAPELRAIDAASLDSLRKQAAPWMFVQAAARSAWLQFARSERCAQLRESGCLVALGAPGERQLLRLPTARPTTGTRRWFRDSVSTALDWEAFSLRSVSARGPRDTDVARAPFLGWKASGNGAQFQGGEIQGVWIDIDGEPQAHFDVGASLEWVCAGRILSVWPVEGWSDLREADAADELANFDLPPVPDVRGDDWRFTALDSRLVASAQTTLGRRAAAGQWRLSLCNLETLEQASFECSRQDSVAAQDGWIARGAGRTASAWARQRQELSWCIEYIALGVALVRAEGLVRPTQR